MLIKEFRIVMPMSVDEYRIGQLWSINEASKNHTGGGEGIEIVTNETFTDTPIFENLDSGQHTYKIYHLKSRIPTVMRLFMPKGAMQVHEEGWNCFPYSRTVLTNPGFMKENFLTKIESLHLPDRGTTENAHNLPPELLAKREVITIDIANDAVRQDDIREGEDPTKFISQKSGRGPISGKWIQTIEPVMCCYKLVFVEFKWFGLQNRVEKFIQNAEKRIFHIFHRQIFCWMDNWYGLTLDDIRHLEEETKHELDKKRYTGNICGFSTE